MYNRIVAFLLLFTLLFTACSQPQPLNDWQQQYDLGIKYLNEGNYEEAIIAFTAAIEIEPQNPLAYIELSNIYIRNGDKSQAMRILQQGLEATNDNVIRDILLALMDSNQMESSVEDIDTDYIIEWKDPVIEEAVRYLLDMPDGNIMRSDLDSITKFSIWKGAKNFEDLVHFRNLEILDGTGIGVDNIDSLPPLPKLKILSFYWNEIKDISSLAPLTNLTRLWLGGNQIEDISPLSGLANLEDLDINKNMIKDIQYLSPLTNLTYLHLGENQIEDISPLSGLTNLERLHLYKNRISDISALSTLDKLDTLWLWGNPITDWSPVEHLPDGVVDVRP